MSAHGNITCDMCGASYYELESHICDMADVKAELDALREQLAAAEQKMDRTCSWYDDGGCWISQCGNAWTFNADGDDGPAENDMKFCPFCGGAVVLNDDDELLREVGGE